MCGRVSKAERGKLRLSKDVGHESFLKLEALNARRTGLEL